MHDQGTVHGDLKGVLSNPSVTLPQPNLPDPKANVLVDQNGHACLAGFTFLTIAKDLPTDPSPAAQYGTVRWMGPELLDPGMLGLGNTPPTKKSDCYALGMVIYEVLSGQRPFALYRDFTVIQMILEGDHPKRPQGGKGKVFTDDMWGILERCWKPRPRDRMSAEAVLLGLEEHPPLRRPSSKRDRGVETDSDEELESDSDDQSESSSDDQSDNVTEGSDCTFSPAHPRLIFNFPCAV